MRCKNLLLQLIVRMIECLYYLTYKGCVRLLAQSLLTYLVCVCVCVCH